MNVLGSWLVKPDLWWHHSRSQASLSAALKKSFHFMLHVLRVRDTSRVFAGDVLRSFPKFTSFDHLSNRNRNHGPWSCRHGEGPPAGTHVPPAQKRRLTYSIRPCQKDTANLTFISLCMLMYASMLWHVFQLTIWHILHHYKQFQESACESKCFENRQHRNVDFFKPLKFHCVPIPRPCHPSWLSVCFQVPSPPSALKLLFSFPGRAAEMTKCDLMKVYGT